MKTLAIWLALIAISIVAFWHFTNNGADRKKDPVSAGGAIPGIERRYGFFGIVTLPLLTSEFA